MNTIMLQIVYCRLKIGTAKLVLSTRLASVQAAIMRLTRHLQHAFPILVGTKFDIVAQSNPEKAHEIAQEQTDITNRVAPHALLRNRTTMSSTTTTA